MFKEIIVPKKFIHRIKEIVSREEGIKMILDSLAENSGHLRQEKNEVWYGIYSELKLDPEKSYSLNYNTGVLTESKDNSKEGPE